MQLKTQWINKSQVAILRGNQVVAASKVRYFSDRRFLSTQGNAKTKGVVGMINCVANGCFRCATGFEKCEQDCYNACYANKTYYALKNKKDSFNVISNGMENDFFHINLPEGESPNYKLNTLKIWRFGSETSDSSLALSLDIIEPWIKNNPDKSFVGINSDYFFVSAEKLRKLSAYDNIVIGHTVSMWFGEDDLQNRLKQIERYQGYGIPTVVWITTNPDWLSSKKEERKQQKLVKDILKLVSPNQIIEVPFHKYRKYQEPVLKINPDGYCCEFRKCKGCKILCGVRFLKQK